MYKFEVIDVIRNIATENTNRIAVIEDEYTFTYKRLNEDSDKIAIFLVSNNIGVEDVVGIRLSRSYFSICATIGVMKAGAAFLPIDKGVPIDRVKYMCEISRAKVIITDSEDVQLSEKAINIENVFNNKFENFNLEEAKYANDQLAYIIFTSGSTGVPKGVMVEYGGMQNHLSEKARLLSICKESIVAFNASISFDISVWQMLTPLCAGGTISVFTNEDVAHANRFCKRLINTTVTLLEVVPTYLNLIIDESQRSNFTYPKLQKVLSTGEELTSNTVKRWFELSHSIPLINAYGPTEASDDVTHCVIEHANQYKVIPIGQPIKNTNLSVISEQGQACSIGEKGELWISGICVGRGYIGNDEETRRHFFFDEQLNSYFYKTGDLVSLESDGNYLFHGRIDTQIKVRGYRIELSEIENAIEKCDNNIIKAVAVYDFNRPIINACYVATFEVDKNSIKEKLRDIFPAYMIPSEIKRIDSIPFTINGKVDRLSLLSLFSNNVSHDEDITEDNTIVSKIKQCISEVLDKELPENDDWKTDMQDIGLDSLFIIKLILKIEDAYDFEFPDEDIKSEIIYNFNNLVDSVKKNVRYVD